MTNGWDGPIPLSSVTRGAEAFCDGLLAGDLGSRLTTPISLEMLPAIPSIGGLVSSMNLQCRAQEGGIEHQYSEVNIREPWTKFVVYPLIGPPKTANTFTTQGSTTISHMNGSDFRLFTSPAPYVTLVSILIFHVLCQLIVHDRELLRLLKYSDFGSDGTRGVSNYLRSHLACSYRE